VSGDPGLLAVAEALAAAEATRSRVAKVEALAAALRRVGAGDDAHLPFVARMLTGTMLPIDDERTLGAGGRLVFDAACEVTGATPNDLGARTGRLGDMGSAVDEALRAKRGADARSATDATEGATDATPSTGAAGVPLADVEALALTLAESGSRAVKHEALLAVLARCTPLEARYLVRAVLGEMRVGAREGIVEDAIAKAFERPLPELRRAASFVTDLGEVASLARADRLAEARPTLGRPMGFMLATPIESARGADLTVPHAVEDKIDGIRAQAHVSATGVHLFARGKGSVTVAFPDVTAPLAKAAADGTLPPAILDGELVVVTTDGRPRPFSAIQPRLKKLAPDEDLLARCPVAYLAYDLLFEGDAPLVDLPFSERRARLARWADHAPAPLRLHDSRALADDTVEAEFDGARGRGHEGLVLKRLDAPYAAGVRGFAWLKVKKALATLDVVLVAAERGHGKRAGVLSDYTFAVRDGDALLTIGKAYNGLTDAEIRTMTERLLAIASTEEQRGYLQVRPEIVMEVAFDGLQRSTRHSSGFALRFPRFARIRDDKTAAEIDTLDAVRALWDAQVASGHREEAAPTPDAKPTKTRGRRSGRRPDIRQKSRQLKLFDD